MMHNISNLHLFCIIFILYFFYSKIPGGYKKWEWIIEFPSNEALVMFCPQGESGSSNGVVNAIEQTAKNHCYDNEQQRTVLLLLLDKIKYI